MNKNKIDAILIGLTLSALTVKCYFKIRKDMKGANK